VVRSFWSIAVWEKPKDPSLRMLGFYTHTISGKNGKWLIERMRIDPWVAGDPAA
jgi:hypothetical protein